MRSHDCKRSHTTLITWICEAMYQSCRLGSLTFVKLRRISENVLKGSGLKAIMCRKASICPKPSMSKSEHILSQNTCQISN